MKLKNTIVFYTDGYDRHGYFSYESKDETNALKIAADITDHEYDTEEKEAIIDALSQEDGDAIILAVIYKNNVIYESEQCEAYYNVK